MEEFVEVFAYVVEALRYVAATTLVVFLIITTKLAILRGNGYRWQAAGVSLTIIGMFFYIVNPLIFDFLTYIGVILFTAFASAKGIETIDGITRRLKSGGGK